MEEIPHWVVGVLSCSVLTLATVLVSHSAQSLVRVKIRERNSAHLIDRCDATCFARTEEAFIPERAVTV
jgi:hypothetical protein